MISAPDLAYMYFEDSSYPLQLFTDLHHLEKVDICLSYLSEDKAKAQNVVCLLQQLHSVKFLTLNLEIIELLSSNVELISHQPSPFANLKGLKIYPDYVTREAEDQTQPEATMSTEVKNYMLDGSPGAILTMVSHDEVRVMNNVTLARNLMGELHVLQDQWKENSETNTTDMEQDKALMESHMATMPEQVEVENQLNAEMEGHSWERMTHVTEQLAKGRPYTDRTFSLLQKIDGVLTKLPASHRAKLQARFDGLCAEAEASMDVMVNHIKNQWDKKPSHYFHELATTLQPSS